MSTIREEQAFLRGLQALVREGRKNGGSLSEEELDRFREERGLSEEQCEQVRAYLRQSGIRVEPAGGSPAGEEAEELPLPDGGPAPGSLPEDALMPEGNAWLREYEELVRSMPQPPKGVLDALRISAMAGDRSAQRQLAEYSLPHVLDIARLYVQQGVSAEDLVSAGNEALTVAVSLLGPLEKPDEVDPFLVSRIMGAMEELVAENLDRRAADREMEDLVNRVAEKADQLSELLGRKISAEELAREGEVSIEEILEALRLTGGMIEAFERNEQQ